MNPGGHMPPGLNRGDKGEKPDNPNKPEKPDNPGTEDKTDKQANKANKGTHKYTYDELNRMTTSNIAGTTTTYTYDTLGNLVLEKAKNHVVDYQYNELNQLVQKKDGNESYTYTYDKRGNCTAEIGKKASRSYAYDETNRMVEGTNWKGDKSAYTYNGLGLRINNTHTTHAGKAYARDYVIDYTSFENDDLMVYAEGNGQLEYEQKHVYAGSERIEQFTDKGNWERILYVHEDVMGNTRYYTKANGQSFAELTYDAWGMPESPNKLLNNDHGNYVFATFTGHIYDTALDIYFAEARFYDADNRIWLAMDPIKDGLNWYQYCYSNPTTYWDPFGLKGDMVTGGGVPAVGKATEKAVERASQSKFNKMNCQTQKSSGIGLTAISEIKMLELWSNARKPSGIDIGSQISLLAEKMLRSIGASQKDIMNSLYGLSTKGFNFLIQYELGTDLSIYSYIRLDANGNILSIRNQDVGDGGITVGFGIYVEASDINRINLLKTLGIDATDLTQWVSIGAATTAFNMISPHYEGIVNDFLSRRNISVTQAQYDALYMFGYNREAFLQTNGAVDTMVSTNNTNINDWRIEVINEYKSLPQWPTFGNGWTNRTEDELELYFYNDYWRTH